VILALRRLRPELLRVCEFQDSLNYIVRPCLEKPNKQIKLFKKMCQCAFSTTYKSLNQRKKKKKEHQAERMDGPQEGQVGRSQPGSSGNQAHLMFPAPSSRACRSQGLDIKGH
jgi:hypothetical protein